MRFAKHKQELVSWWSNLESHFKSHVFLNPQFVVRQRISGITFKYWVAGTYACYQCFISVNECMRDLHAIWFTTSNSLPKIKHFTSFKNPFMIVLKIHFTITIVRHFWMSIYSLHFSAWNWIIFKGEILPWSLWELKGKASRLNLSDFF